MAVAIPFIGIGIVNASGGSPHEKLGLGLAFLIVEVVTIIAARSAFHNYVDRATHILEGFVYAERVGERQKGGQTETGRPAAAASPPTPPPPPPPPSKR